MAKATEAQRDKYGDDISSERAKELDQIESDAETIWVYSTTGGGTTGHNLNEMTPAQVEQLYGRIAVGELREASGPDDTPKAPDEVLEARVARRAVADPAGSLMAPVQGVDPQRVRQELADGAPDEVKAEYEAVRELGDPGEVPADTLLEAKQAAGTSARVRGLRESARGARAVTSPGGGTGESDADASAAPRESATKGTARDKRS
jgi:hypothetical protein